MPATMENITVSIPKRLVTIVEQVVKENKTNRSKVISQCLEDFARRRREKLMIQYYEKMAKEHEQLIPKSVGVIQKIASEWGD